MEHGIPPAGKQQEFPRENKNGGTVIGGIRSFGWLLGKKPVGWGVRGEKRTSRGEEGQKKKNRKSGNGIRCGSGGSTQNNRGGKLMQSGKTPVTQIKGRPRESSTR